MTSAPMLDPTALKSTYHILIVNPNSTDGFTHSMRDHISSFFPPSTYPNIHLTFITAPSNAPASITSSLTSVTSAAYTLPAIVPYLPSSHSASTNTPPADAILIACFSAHPLVPMLRELTTIPITGIMQASILLASQLGGRPGILTTDRRWEPLLTHELNGDLHLSGQCLAGVMSSGLSVLELESLPLEEVKATLAKTALRLVKERQADVIVLGCAGMVGLDVAVAKAVGGKVTVVDPVRAGVEMCVALARLGLKTAKSGIYEEATF